MITNESSIGPPMKHGILCSSVPAIKTSIVLQPIYYDEVINQHDILYPCDFFQLNIYIYSPVEILNPSFLRATFMMIIYDKKHASAKHIYGHYLNLTRT
jgi:hypothetical protein